MMFRKNIVVSFQSHLINCKDAQDCVHSVPLFDRCSAILSPSIHCSFFRSLGNRLPQSQSRLLL